MKHEDITKFNNESERRGYADVPVDDIFFVAANIVVPEYGSIDSSLQQIPTEDLSLLTTKSAVRNRVDKFRQKVFIYCNENTVSSEELYEDKAYVELHDKINTSCTIFDIDREALLTRNGADERKRRQMTKKVKLKDLNTNQENTSFMMDHEDDEAISIKANGNNYEDEDELWAEHEKLIEEVRKAEVEEELGDNTDVDNTDIDDSIGVGGKRRKLLNDLETRRKMNRIQDQGMESYCEKGRANKDGTTGMSNVKRIKMYIKGRATELLSKDEHAQHRTYAKAIEAYLGSGRSLATKFTKGSPKARDQSGKVEYCPALDMVTVYACPDYDHVCKRTGHPVGKEAKYSFQKSVETTTSCIQVHLGFKRTRRFMLHSPLKCLTTGARLGVRGLMGTLDDIIKICSHPTSKSSVDCSTV